MDGRSRGESARDDRDRHKVGVRAGRRYGARSAIVSVSRLGPQRYSPKKTVPTKTELRAKRLATAVETWFKRPTTAQRQSRLQWGRCTDELGTDRHGSSAVEGGGYGGSGTDDGERIASRHLSLF